LKASDLGSAARAPFEPDPDLPRGFAKVTSRVYNNSGFDRGHMCAAKDRSSSPADIRATFFLTNVVPQAPNCNHYVVKRITWRPVFFLAPPRGRHCLNAT
jgi:endonuclease G, mitochondrial